MKKKDIVKSRIDFNKIIQTGKKVSNECFAIYYKDNNISKCRYGVSVGTKLGNAVFRNKYKRKIRMIITTNMNLLNKENKDIIIIFRQSGIDKAYQELDNKYINLIEKIKEN